MATDVLSAVRRAILAINKRSRLNERVGLTSTATAWTGIDVGISALGAKVDCERHDQRDASAQRADD